jgi:tRNA(fMet)-specific endonuclease VapC
MSTFLLDTNIWIGLSNGDPVLSARIEGIPQHQIASCSVVRAELLFGAYKSRKVETNLQGIDKLLGPFVSFPFDDEFTTECSVQNSKRVVRPSAPMT